MAKTEKLTSIKRFGARYGTKVKQRFGKIEQEQRKKHKCPFCSAQKVKRVILGIWHCGRCDAKFTSKAYTVRQKTFKAEEVKGEQKNG